MKKIPVMGLLPALLAVALGASSNAAADDETFRVKSMAESEVQIKFFSQDRHVVWPGPDEHYTLSDYGEHAFRLRCVNGEKICYGAWVSGDEDRYWGAGYDGSEGCSSCCVTCQGGQTTTYILRDPVRR